MANNGIEVPISTATSAASSVMASWEDPELARLVQVQQLLLDQQHKYSVPSVPNVPHNVPSAQWEKMPLFWSFKNSPLFA